MSYVKQGLGNNPTIIRNDQSPHQGVQSVTSTVYRPVQMKVSQPKTITSFEPIISRHDQEIETGVYNDVPRVQMVPYTQTRFEPKTTTIYEDVVQKNYEPVTTQYTYY